MATAAFRGALGRRIRFLCHLLPGYELLVMTTPHTGTGSTYDEDNDNIFWTLVKQPTLVGQPGPTTASMTTHPTLTRPPRCYVCTMKVSESALSWTKTEAALKNTVSKGKARVWRMRTQISGDTEHNSSSVGTTD